MPVEVGRGYKDSIGSTKDGQTEEGRQWIIHTDGPICTTIRELLHSEIFERTVNLYCDALVEQDSPIVQAFLPAWREGKDWTGVVNLLRILADNSWEKVVSILPRSETFPEAEVRRALHRFVEGLYDFWRSRDRFMILQSEPGPSSFDRRSYRSFNAIVETLVHQVRAAYRDICENITGDHPRVYRQILAGVDVVLIAVPRDCRLPAEYEQSLSAVPFIRHVWMTPPLIIDPPMNKRTGKFQKINASFLTGLSLEKDKWLCHPVQVGPLLVFVYFHQRFIGLACSLGNLFEMATDEQIEKGPNAVYLFGAPAEHLSRYGDLPTVFYDDEANGLVLAAVPGEERFGYFGYLKKMILTLHNVIMMKRGRMPYHGAMVHISLKGCPPATILIVGDTGAGKSDTAAFTKILP